MNFWTTKRYLPSLVVFAALISVALLVSGPKTSSTTQRDEPLHTKETSAQPQITPPETSKTLRVVAVGSNSFKPRHGFDWPMAMGIHVARRIIGSNASILIEGHESLNTQPSEMIFTLAPTGLIPAKDISLSIYINLRKVSEITAPEYGFREYVVSIEPKTLIEGDNLIWFRAERHDGRIVADHERHIALERVELRLQ